MCYHACHAAALEENDARKDAEVSRAAAAADDDDDDDDVAIVLLSVESNIDTETATKSSHILDVIHAAASGFAAAADDISDWQLIKALRSDAAMAPSCAKMAKAAAEINKNLSLEKSDLETSDRSMRVKFSMRCFARVGMSLD